MRDTIEASTETVRGRVITAADPDHDDDARCTGENDGASSERPSAVKAVYDPDSLFHVNQNIAPAKRR